MRRYLAHGAGSMAASSYLGELTACMLSAKPVADMQHNAASLRYRNCSFLCSCLQQAAFSVTGLLVRSFQTEICY